jgi:hypothetical protein
LWELSEPSCANSVFLALALQLKCPVHKSGPGQLNWIMVDIILQISTAVKRISLHAMEIPYKSKHKSDKQNFWNAVNLCPECPNIMKFSV